MDPFEEYVARAREVHGDKYEYKELYYNAVQKRWFLKILCAVHGIFDKKVGNHITNKQGCPSCTRKYVLTQADFLERCKSKHGNRYSYDKAVYVNNTSNVIITCTIHGDFSMTPKNHTQHGQVCPQCSINAKLTTTSLVEKLEVLRGDIYDYSKVEYQGAEIEVILICKTHGEFSALAHNLLDKRTEICCHRCRKSKVLCTKDFIEDANKVHSNLYDYGKTEYVSSIEKVIICCPTHGEFLQRPTDHLSGRNGCPSCGKGRSSGISIEWLEQISATQNVHIQHAMNGGEHTVFIDGKRYFFDGYDSLTNTVYEFYGDLFHGNPEKYNRDDLNPLNKISFGTLYDRTIARENTLKAAGYNLITIWESVFRKSRKNNRFDKG